MQSIYTTTGKISLHALKVRIFAALSFTVLALIVAYISLLALSVKHVVERKEAEVLTAQTRTEITVMEREYLARVSDLTEVRAERIGLTRVATKNFTERRVLVGRAQ